MCSDMEDVKLVHSCCYSSHNSLQIACDQSWTTAKWGPPGCEQSGIEGVFVSDDDRLYTFRSELVTCIGCKG